MTIRRQFLIIFLAAFSSLPSFAAFNSTAVWEVQFAGSDNNGGAFDLSVGAPGTDETLTPTTCTADIVVGATTTQATATTCAFSTTVHGPGNFINITGGTGCTVQRVEMLSQTTGTATFDKSLGTAASTCTGIIGGPLQTFATAFGQVVAGNDIWAKFNASPFPISVGLSWTTTCTSAAPCRLMGYTTTRGDNGRVTIQATAGMTNMLSDTGFYHQIKNIILDANLKASTTALNFGIGTDLDFSNGEMINWTVKGATLGSNSQSIRNSRITGGQAGCTVGIDSQGRTYVEWNEIDTNSCTGLRTSAAAGLVANYNLIHDNTGASTDCIQFTIAAAASSPVLIEHNTLYGCGRDGIRGTINNGFESTRILNNIIAGNAGIGINNQGAGAPINYLNARSNYNTFQLNTGGDLSNWPHGAFDICSSGCAGGTVSNVTSIFVNAASKNFALNNTTGAGAVVRAAGFPGAFLGGTTTGYIDPGAVQTQVTTGGGQTSYAIAQ